MPDRTHSRRQQSDVPDDSPASKVRARQFTLVAGCFLISGFAALIYETVWLRQFAILLGTSEQALAVVLASYMGGLAIGSLVASRVVDSIRRPLLTYGLLELGIAVSALLVPLGLSLAGSLQASLLGGAAEPPESGSLIQTAFCFSTALGLIMIPTGLMGATLPLLARHVVSRDQDLGPKIGLLYAINTAGAVLGTMFAAFYCLGAFGLGQTTWIGASANFLVFALVLLLVRNRGVERVEVKSEQPTLQGPSAQQHDKNERATKGSGRRRRENKRRRKQRSLSPDQTASSVPANQARYHWILLFAAISGGVAFCYEIVFTRMLGHMLGGSVFAFATMLAGFLLGIALGGAIASRLAITRRAAVIGFVYAQASAAICTLFAFHLVDDMMGWEFLNDNLGWGSTTLIQVLASIMALLPTATCIGATFPFAIRIYAKDETEAARGSARVYFWNVLGGIVGALATGTILLPVLQYHGATSLAILGNILIAMGVVFVMRTERVHVALPLVAAAALGFVFPTEPVNVLRRSALAGVLAEGEILYNHVGKSATVTIFYKDGEISFQTNGLPESKIPAIGSGGFYRNESVWLSALPPLMRPGCESMLIVGLGGGVAAASTPPSVQTIDVFELESAVVEANRVVAPLREFNPLADPRINIIINDARNALALTEKKYDAIVSQPSHPWTAGASHLYTSEFNALIRDHLNPGGVFLQWMHSEFVDSELTRSMGATLLDVFPYVRMYQPLQGAFMFIASDQPIRPEDITPSPGGEITLCEMPPLDREYYERLGIVTPTHLFAVLSLDTDGLKAMCEGAPLITDERNLLAMRAPALLRKHDQKQVQAFVESHSPVSRSLDVALELCPSLDLAVFANQKLDRISAQWVRQFTLPLFERPDERALIEANLIQATESFQAYAAHLTRSAMKYPENKEIPFLVLSNAALGKSMVLSDDEQQQLQRRLSDSHRMIIELIHQMVANNLEPAFQHDAELAAIPHDDVAYDLAVRLRIPWRLETQGSERIRRASEAVSIIDQSAPHANEDGLAWFRAAAAINARQPLVALGTIGQLANTVRRALDEPEQKEAAALPTLIRCYELLADPAPFVSMNRRYQEVLFMVESVLQRTNSR
jgi:spermidine synthase